MIAEITLSLHMAVEENAETRCDENARLVALRSPEQKMPFGRFWHAEPNAIIKAIGYAMQQPFTGCSDQRLREAGKVIETHEHAVEFKEW